MTRKRDDPDAGESPLWDLRDCARRFFLERIGGKMRMGELNEETKKCLLFAPPDSNTERTQADDRESGNSRQTRIRKERR